MTATATRPRTRKPKPAPLSPQPIYDSVLADLGIDPADVSAQIAAITGEPYVFGTDQ